MLNKSSEPTPRNFDPMSAIGLSDEAREAVHAAFDAMSTWRIETAKSSEKNSEQVIEKMAAAARALGWPDEFVETIRAQMQSVTKLQMQTMDQIMDAWEEQLKAPNPMNASPAAMLSKLKSWPDFGPAGSWPGADVSRAGSVNPLQIWMHFAEQWQKASVDAMAFWSKGGSRHDPGASRNR